MARLVVRGAERIVTMDDARREVTGDILVDDGVIAASARSRPTARRWSTPAAAW